LWLFAVESLDSWKPSFASDPGSCLGGAWAMAGIWMACQWFWLPIVLGGLDRWGCWAAVGCLSCIILFLVRSMLLVGELLELVSGLSGDWIPLDYGCGLKLLAV